MNPKHVDFYIRLWKAPLLSGNYWRLIYRGYPDGAAELETEFLETGLSCSMRTVPAGEPPADDCRASQCLRTPDMELWKRWEVENPSTQHLERSLIVQVPRTIVRPLDRMMTWEVTSVSGRWSSHGARHEGRLVDAAEYRVSPNIDAVGHNPCRQFGPPTHAYDLSEVTEHVGGRTVEAMGYSQSQRWPTAEESNYMALGPMRREREARLLREHEGSVELVGYNGLSGLSEAEIQKARRILQANPTALANNSLELRGGFARDRSMAAMCGDGAMRELWRERWANQELKARSARKTLEFGMRYNRPEDPNKDS